MNNTPSTPAHIVGANVKAEIGRRSVTQGQLAAHLGMTQSSLSKRILGRIAFDVDELASVASFLDVPLAVLTEGVAA